MKSLEALADSFPILPSLSQQLKKNAQVTGMKIGWHCHLTGLTALTVKAMAAAGATMFLSECNADTTDIQAVEYMRALKAQVYLGPSAADAVLEHCPVVLADTGLALIERYLASAQYGAFAGSEITTSGITRLRSHDCVPLPVVNINEGQLKRFIENFHGVGDGLADALSRLTGRMWAGRRAAVVGYGQVGAGVASYLRRLGALVTVVEKDPIRRLTAHYDGCLLADLDEALRCCQLLVTATGQERLISSAQWQIAADGLFVFNVGHWSSEIDRQSLIAMSDSVELVNEHLEGFIIDCPPRKKIYLAAQGSPVNVVLLSGSIEPTLIHLTTEMLAVEFLCRLKRSGQKLPPGEMTVPIQIEQTASNLALDALGFSAQQNRNSSPSTRLTASGTQSDT